MTSIGVPIGQNCQVCNLGIFSKSIVKCEVVNTVKNIVESPGKFWLDLENAAFLYIL